MKKIINSLNLMSRLSNHFILLLVSAIVIPFLLLCILGIWFIYTKGYIPHFVGFLAFLSLIFFLLHLLIKISKKGKSKKVLEDEITIETSPQWSKRENDIWKKLEELVDKKFENDIEWGELQVHSLEIISKTADHYHPDNSEKELAVSISELLLGAEEVIRRYRGYIKEYIPFEDKVKLSFLKQGYDHKDKQGIIKNIYNIYRVYRMSNPVEGIASEIKSKLTAPIFDSVSTALQNKLKRALLKDVASVSIDLYRGHFKIKDNELPESKGNNYDKTQQAPHIELLRISIVGQVSSGKSSLINALTDNMIAEISILPSTDGLEIHTCKVDSVDTIKLVDLPGLNGDLETEDLIVKEMINSDIVLWVIKANQSARKLDMQIRDKFEEFYQNPKNMGKKKPSILMLLNQVDMLQPVSEWSPPYDLTHCNADNKKYSNIEDALKYNNELLNPDKIFAISLSQNKKHYNIQQVKQYLQETYDDGINTQLNRRRQQYSSESLIENGKKLWKGIKAFSNL